MKLRKSVCAKALSAVLVLAMTLAMSTVAFAIDNTGGTPAAYNPAAHITVGKTLTTEEAGVWPDVTQFQFTLTADSYTAGPDTTQAGTGYISYTNANMPMPVVGSSNTAAAGTPQATTVTVNGFSNAAAGTEQSHNAVTGDITYTQSGVYTYTLREVIPSTRVPGINYDESLYYVNVYVTNVLNSNNNPVLNEDGTAKVTVSNITAYKTENAADLTNAGGTTPNAEAATGKVNIVTPGGSDGTVRNITYPFENVYTSRDLTVSKKVAGTLADPQKEFTFSIALTDANNAADTRTYNYKVYTMGPDQVVYNGDDVEETDKAGSITSANHTFTLKHNEYIVIIGLADGEKYTVTESGAADYTTAITPQNGTAAGAAVNGKTGGQQTLNTADGAANHTDFVNTKNVTPPTGVVLDMLPYLLIVGLAGAALAAISRKRRYSAQ